MINWNQFTVDNGAITDLRELLFLTIFNDPDIDSIVSNETGVVNGKKLGFIDTMGDVGLAGGGCDPEYSSVNITGLEKTWELGDWEIAKSICYKELENTLAKYGMKTGTEIADLQNTPYWDIVLMPLLKKAITEMFWRIIWFGDKNAENVSSEEIPVAEVSAQSVTIVGTVYKGVTASTEDAVKAILANGTIVYLSDDAATEVEEGATYYALTGEQETVRGNGVITENVDVKLLNMCDGLWKRVFTICAANPQQHTAIEANSEDSYEDQKSAIRESGAAIEVFDALLSDADSRIFDYDDHAILCTGSLFRALRHDLKATYGQSTLPFEFITSGINASEYDGHKIIVLEIWDRLIKKFEDNGVTLNLPHRALCCSPKNLFVGTSDVDKIATLSVTFDDVTRKNYIYATSKIGTLIGEDELIQAAY